MSVIDLKGDNKLGLSKEAIEARRLYNRNRYKAKKEAGEVYKDRYTPEKRAEYNRNYKESNKDKLADKRAEYQKKHWEGKVNNE